jgi:uncharacterized membrane protein HdeD (DUF308 family)
MFSFTAPLSRGHAALRGVLALALGVVFLIWPGITIGTALVLFAVWCFVDAFVALTRLFSSGKSAGDRVLQILTGWLVVGGLLSIVAGVLLIVWPDIGTVTLAIVFGAYLAAYGLTLLGSAALTSKGDTVPDPLTAP